MMTAQEFESLMDDFASALEAFAHGTSDDVGALRGFLVRNPNVITLIREREQDTHDRVRRSYDKTVADSWRVRVEELECALGDIEMMMSLHGLHVGKVGRDVHAIIDGVLGEPPHKNSMGRRAR